jgi:hypothetical protein
MADQEDGLLAIEVDADDYAETAAGDTPSVSRTYQSEPDFQAIKTSYAAKQDGNNTYQDLIAAVPALKSNDALALNRSEQSTGHAKVRLGKKDLQLLGYAVGEMYFDKEYARILELCHRVRGRCDVDAKTVGSLDRLERRCRDRLGQ